MDAQQSSAHAAAQHEAIHDQGAHPPQAQAIPDAAMDDDDQQSQHALPLDSNPDADADAATHNHIQAHTHDSSIDPSARRESIRHVQHSLLAGAAHGKRAPELLDALRSEYARAAEETALLPSEWTVYLATLLQPHAEALLTPPDLDVILQAHAASFERLTDTRLVCLYISILLHYFGIASGIHVLTSATLMDDAEAEGDQDDDNDGRDAASHQPAATQDPLALWTGLSGGPKIDVPSYTYVTASLPELHKSHQPGQEDPAEADAAALIDVSAWAELLGVEAVRSRIRAAYSRCAYHLDNSQSIWQIYLAFERALLASNQVATAAQTEIVKQVYLSRLRVPHRGIDETFQAYSRFVTNYLPAEDYEEELLAANKLFALSKRSYSEREQYEDSLAALQAYRQQQQQQQSSSSASPPRPDPTTFAIYWKPYLLWQQKATARTTAKGKDKALAQLEPNLASALFERAIVQHGTYPPSAQAVLEDWEASPPNPTHLHEQRESQKKLRRAEKEQLKVEAEQRLTERLSIAEGLWLDYVSTLHLAVKPDVSLILDACERSIRVLPTSPSAYTAYMRQLSRFLRPKSQIEDVFARIMGVPATAEKGAALVDLLIARVDCECEAAVRELATTSEVGLDADPASSMDKFMEVYALLSYGLGETAKLQASERDATLRLERYAVDWVERAIAALGGPASEAGAGLNELAESVWQNAVKLQSENARVYREAAAYWTRRYDTRKARAWYKGGVNKFERSLGGSRVVGQDTAAYEALLDEWVQFEHQRGRVEDVDYAISKAKAERQRIWEAWYASYATQQQQQPAAGDAADVVDVAGEAEAVAAAAADTTGASIAAGIKRKPEDAADRRAGASATEAPGQPSATATDTGAASDVSLSSSKKPKPNDEPSRDRENSSVLVSGLPLDATAGSLRSFLRDCGTIVSIVGPRRFSTSSAALVEFDDRSGATSACTRDMKKLHDHVVSIHLGWVCTLFVTNFPSDWDDEEVRAFFGAYGEIFDVRWPSRKFVSTRRFVYVQYTLASSASDALETNGRKLDETCTLTVALSDPTRRKTRSDADANVKELYVSGLPWYITSEEVRSHFETFGEVEAVRMPGTEQGGKSKGIAFVDFRSSLDAVKAMKEMNGSTVKGRRVAVILAKSKGAHGHVPSVTTSHPFSSSSSLPLPTSTSSSSSTIDTKGNRAARRAAEAETRRLRTMHLFGIPVETQEAIIQQAVEKVMGEGKVRKVIWNQDDGGDEAMVEFYEVSDAGRATLQSGFRIGEKVVRVKHMQQEVAKGTTEEVPFQPRNTMTRGRGRGRALLTPGGRRTGKETTRSQKDGDMDVDDNPTDQQEPLTETTVKPKGQDDFRQMLLKR